MHEPKEFMTILEAALWVGVSETMVRRWLKRGLRHLKVGTRNSAIRIRRADLEAFLAGHMVDAKTEP
jgi:excisionase family DNA binding protein